MIGIEGSVVGIDVGCSPVRRSSAVCRLDWNAREVSWTIERFRAMEPERTETIRRVAGQLRLAAAAFDGPLRRRLDITARYRTAERMLTRRLRPFAGKPGQASALIGKLLNEHANRCAVAVLDNCDLGAARHTLAIHDRAVVEAFPRSFLGVMIEDPRALNARRGDRSDTFFQYLAEVGMLHRLVEHCLTGRCLEAHPSTVTNHDERAALVCALTALCVAAGDYSAVGDDDGWIILPPTNFVQGWALNLLRANADNERGSHCTWNHAQCAKSAAPKPSSNSASTATTPSA
jgi:hypothetical protein